MSRRFVRGSVSIAVVLVAAACGGSVGTPPAADTGLQSSSTTSSTPSPSSTVNTEPTPDPKQTFQSAVTVVDAGNQAEVAGTWQADCPVMLEELRLLSLSYWDNAGEVRTGEMVVHADHVAATVQVFESLFGAQFPIERIELIDRFAGDDNASMSANNTSAFNCREIEGRPGVWSQHAYGGAIDINPLVNPWVRGDRVDPPEGAPYVNRDQDVPGLIKEGDVVTEAFAAVGWSWGGDWTETLDYQHFSHNGL